MVKSQKSDTEKDNLIEEGKIKEIDEYKTMLLHSLECKNNTWNII